jgi:uncharacterized protein YecE (DUF72 family)
MMANFYLGTSGWAYKAWLPVFYPEDTSQKNFLRYYSSKLNAVEVNYTFRNRLSEKTTVSWLNDTPKDFRFTLKANQGITHFKRLKDAEESVKRFIDSIAPMEASGRLGAVLFQLPPNMKADVERLDSFLGSLPRTMRTAWEFRHESWLIDATYAALKNHNAALCVAEAEKLVTPDVFTAEFSYFRFRQLNYTPAQRRAIAKRLEQAPSREVFAFFKHEENPESPLNALDVMKRLRKLIAA